MSSGWTQFSDVVCATTTVTGEFFRFFFNFMFKLVNDADKDQTTKSRC